MTRIYSNGQYRLTISANGSFVAIHISRNGAYIGSSTFTDPAQARAFVARLTASISAEGSGAA